MFDQMQTENVIRKVSFFYVKDVFHVSINVLVLYCEVSYFDSNYEYEI